jgi:hypothetical protein
MEKCWICGKEEESGIKKLYQVATSIRICEGCRNFVAEFMIENKEPTNNAYHAYVCRACICWGIHKGKGLPGILKGWRKFEIYPLRFKCRSCNSTEGLLIIYSVDELLHSGRIEFPIRCYKCVLNLKI